MVKQYDIVIVGTGIGGLSTLLYLTESTAFKNGLVSIAIIAKDALDCTNTNWAQGGIAAVHSIGDSFDKHIKDTLVAGAFSNKESIVRKVIEAAPDLLDDLMRWGTNFDKNLSGDIDLAKEGGHSDARIWHFQDQTGYAIEQALLTKLKQFPNIDIFEFAQVTKIVSVQKNTFQLQLFQKNYNEFFDLACTKLVLATGGLGMLYEKTTNQNISTGDGIYFAKQLGATIQDLSFIQFHPTGLVQNGNIAFLISEALRGAGAVLRNKFGDAFMQHYDERAELAPRDIVSRSILEDMSRTYSEFVFLDATAIDIDFLNAHFPAIKNHCWEKLAIDIKVDLIPIIPVQHYSCGGVLVNEFGETSVKNLFAIGELACTGLHGANRLASNSLLEAIAFAKFSVPSLLDISTKPNTSNNLPIISSTKWIDLKLVQKTMSQYAGVVKTNQGLLKALEILKKEKTTATIQESFDLNMFQNEIVLNVAQHLLEDAINQKENKGVHYNKDLV